MRTSLRTRAKQESGFGKGSLVGFRELDSHISRLSSPGASSAKRRLPPSRQSDAVPSSDSSRLSSEAISDIAPEIIVWTSNMDLDSPPSDEPEISSSGPPDAELPAAAEEAPTNLLHAGLAESAHDSFASPLSNLTDQSELSSIPSSISSKATTPVDLDGMKEIHMPPSEPIQPPQTPRRTFDVKPKSSVPSELVGYEYARQCIEAAESSRLNPYALHPEEYLMLRQHITHVQVTTYLHARNGILRLWINNPRMAVTREEAVGCASARWFDVASVCYDWLVRRGYINYGCVEFPQAIVQDQKNKSDQKRKTVVVIGAGMSGLGCARHMEGLFKQYADRFHSLGEEPPRVVVIEGRSRVGGRVFSREFKTKPATSPPSFVGERCTAEMGGMIITGFERGNPMNILVRGQLSLPYHALTPDTTIYDSNGKSVDAIRDQLVENLYNDCLDRVSEFKFKSQPSKLIEGNRDLLNEGKDNVGDGHKTISQAEAAMAALPHAPPVSQQSVPERVNLVPVSSDKLTGRVHNQPGTPATLKASEKAEVMGWTLKTGVSREDNIDLISAATVPGSTLGSVLDDAISQYRNLVDLTPQDHRLINWHIANLEYSNATNLHNLSLGGWDIDAGNEWEGKHTMIVGGYQSVARGLLHCPTSLDLRTRSAVKNIRYESEDGRGPATIECDDGSSIDADYVVCTIPLGVLKQGNVNFEPPLPTWKTDVITRIGFGVLNKVILVYNEPFWDTDRHIFGALRDAPNRHSLTQSEYKSQRGRFFQWFNVSNTTGLPCLLALMAGDAGFDTEHNGNNKLIEEATEVLRSIFGKQVPYPVESVVTRWASDRFARGSYSSAGPDMQPDDYDVMSRSIGNLFFAGEHTIGTHPATVHGAYLSGLRAASEVLDTMLGPIEIPTPLILPKESGSLQKRKEPAEAKDPAQARLEAYEIAAWDHIRSKIGERPIRPGKVAGNAYLLYSRTFFEVARKRCEEERHPGKKKPVPNEVRVMTSKMWKAATPEERKPYEDQALAQKNAYAEAVKEYSEKVVKWDQDAIELRAAFEKEHSLDSAPLETAESRSLSQKHRRIKQVSYAESDGSDTDI